MQSILIKQFSPLILISLMIILTACNEKYSSVGEQSTGASISANPSSKSYTSASAMRWSVNSLGESGLNVFISDEILQEFDQSDYDGDLNPVQQMLSKWNAGVSSKTLFNINSAGDSNALIDVQKEDLLDYNDDIFGVYRHDTWFPDVSSSALAITQFFGKRVNAGTDYEYLELIHADIVINYRNFSFGIGNKSLEDYDLSSVILHELGHFLGLGHSGYYENSVMVPYLDVGTEKRELLDYDIKSISNLYDSARTTTSALMTINSISSNKAKPTINREQEIVQGIIELQADGECRHFIDGKLVDSHKKKPGHFRPGFK